MFTLTWQRSHGADLVAEARTDQRGIWWPTTWRCDSSSMCRRRRQRFGRDRRNIEVTPIQLITGSRRLQGWASGTTADEEDTLRFAELV